MAKFMPYWKPGKAPILKVTLTVLRLPREAIVVVDGVEKYRGRSLTKANQICNKYRAKMDAQIKAV